MFDQYIERLKELHEQNSFFVESRLSSFMYHLESDMKNKKDGEEKPSFLAQFGIYEHEDYVYIAIIIIVMLLYGFLLGIEVGLYAAGMAFFIAGFLIGQLKGFGLIFLFSHGGSGLWLMVASLLGGVESLDGMVFSGPQKICLGIAILIFVCAVLGNVIYNLSDSLKENKMNKVYLLGLFLLGLIIVGMVPKISI